MWGFLSFFREVLGLFQMVSSDRKGSSGINTKAGFSSRSDYQPSLQLPPVMVDLIFIFCFVFISEMSPMSETIVSHTASLPTLNSAGKKPVTPLALRPVKSGGSWLYITQEGHRLTVAEVVDRVRSKHMSPILVIENSSSIQTYLDAHQQLSVGPKGLKKIALAVRTATNGVGK